LTVTNGSVIALSGSGSSYTASVLPIAVGLVTVTVPAGAAVDAAGNGNLASTPVSVTYTVAGPSVTVNQAATQANPTTTPTIAFTASFSTPVTGFTASNVALSGTASGPLTVAVTAADTLGASYTLTVTGLTSSGTVSASVPANQVFVSGAPNFASTNTNDLVVYNAPSTAGSASTNAASSGGGGGGGGCGSGLNAAILPMLMLFLWRRKRS
jgi:hypothetical protein